MVDRAYIKQSAREVAESDDKRIVGLCRAFGRQWVAAELRAREARQHADEAMVILACFEAVAAARGLTVSEDPADGAALGWGLRPVPCVMCDNGDGHLRHACPRNPPPSEDQG